MVERTSALPGLQRVSSAAASRQLAVAGCRLPASERLGIHPRCRFILVEWRLLYLLIRLHNSSASSLSLSRSLAVPCYLSPLETMQTCCRDQSARLQTNERMIEFPSSEDLTHSESLSLFLPRAPPINPTDRPLLPGKLCESQGAELRRTLFSLRQTFQVSFSSNRMPAYSIWLSIWLDRPELELSF